MFTNLIAIQYCFTYLIDQIPVGLLLYSHLPTALIALLFGAYVLIKARNLSSTALFVMCLSFAVWCVLDLNSWFAFLGSGIIMFSWSLLDLFGLLFFFFGYYFLYTFIYGSDLPRWQKVLGIGLMLPTAIWTFLGQTLQTFDANTCEATEHELFTLYPYFVEGFLLLAVVTLAILGYRKTQASKHKREIVLASTGVFICLFFFFTATAGVNFLVNYDIGEYAYNFEIYGLFGMPILLIYLGYLIVRYKAFDLKIFGAQALLLALIAVIGSEFAFVQTLTTRILVSITLVLTAAVGLVLVRSVRKEIEQREHIELLALDLEKSNKQQIILIHFITHQIKGFVTKSRNIFSLLIEGDYGKIPDTMKSLVEEGFRSDTKGVNTIQEILNAANIKSGNVTYEQAPYDLKELTEEIIRDLKSAADAKHLALTLETTGDSFATTGDRAQMQNALKNLIDNSIKYTPSGSVTVTLTMEAGKLRFMIQDTGVGITADDMAHLFTEGGHGKESQKINVESTGFGLYIVKNIIVAQHGKVWAESEGAGKGSKFVVELPA